MQTQADRVKRSIGGLGEPSLEAEHAAREAMLAALVVRPALRQRPRGTARLVAMAAVLLLISVAGALAARIDDLFGGPPAPPAIERLIGQANDLGPYSAWASPRIIASETRRLMRVSTAHGDLTLWIAPTRDGDVCLALQHPGEHSLAAACTSRRNPARVSYTVDLAGAVDDLSARSIWGRVPDTTRTLELSFADHTTRAVAVAHGFFVAPVGGADPTLLVARDATGRVVARQPVWPGSMTSRRGQHLLPDGSPSSTIASARRVLVRLKTSAGDVTLSTAPSTYGGRCDWILLGTQPAWVWCQTGFEPVLHVDLGLTLAVSDAAKPVPVFYAYLPPGRLSAARLHFADGRSVTLRPHSRWVLYAFPARTRQPAHRPVAYDLIAPGGRVVTHLAIAALDTTGIFR